MTRSTMMMLRACLLGCAVMPWGCAMTQKEPPPKPFTGTRWELARELPLAGEQPSLRFGDGRMEGFGGCNQVAARYVQDTVGAKSIAIGRIETGTRGCERAAQLAERSMLEVLQSVSSYSITADALTMTGSGGTLRFRAAPEHKP
jgi:heat shock protein HslJ